MSSKKPVRSVTIHFHDGEGCPIPHQIYAWHCIVLSSHYNTVLKFNNTERSRTMRNLTKPCINLLEYWTGMTMGATWRSFAPLQKSRWNQRFHMWTEGLSGMVFVTEQELSINPIQWEDISLIVDNATNDWIPEHSIVSINPAERNTWNKHVPSADVLFTWCVTATPLNKNRLNQFTFRCARKHEVQWER